MTFIQDYRPTLRIGLDELHGACNVFRDRVDELYADADGRLRYYEGAWLALRLIESGRYEYPADFMAVFDNQLDEYMKGGM